MTQAFISYRNTDHTLATRLGRQLVDSGFVDQAMLIPPDRLCEADELLLPFEFFELMEFIVDEMHRSAYFVALDTGTYWQSYWTQAEVGHWQRLRPRPVIHVASIDPAGGLTLDGGTELNALPKADSRLWGRVSFMTNRRVQSNTRGATFTGRYAKSCFFVPCRTCGRHFLASQKAVRAAIDSILRCPCGVGLAVKERDTNGTFYRRPIVLEQQTNRIAPVDENVLLRLLVSDDLPSGVELVTNPGEKLDTDLTRVLKMYGLLGAATVVGAVLWGALSDERE